MQIVSGKKPGPRRTMLYGTHGIGKSTWAAAAPKPIFLQTEEGLNDIDCDRSPLLEDFGTLKVALSWVLTQQHEYRSLVLDTLDWTERLIWSAIAQSGGKKNIEEFGYGKGYTLAVKGWEWLLSSLNEIRRQRGMNIILLAHAKVVKFESPESDSYDRYEPDLHKTASPMLQEWCDEVLFATYRTSVVKSDEGFNRERSRAVGSGDRVMHTCERPAWLAKRRIPLPDTMPLDWAEYQAAWPSAKRGNVDGILNNGSSKRQSEVTSG